MSKNKKDKEKIKIKPDPRLQDDIMKMLTPNDLQSPPNFIKKRKK